MLLDSQTVRRLQIAAPKPKGVTARASARGGGRGSVRARAAATTTPIKQKDVPAKEYEGTELPMNTYSPKKPYTAKIKSVERIVGPKVHCLLCCSCLQP